MERHAALFPSWFCAPAVDWPAKLEVCGFPLPASRSPEPQLLEWLSTRKRPIVFTPGTSPTVSVDHFFEQAIRACQLLEMPGILLSPKVPPLAKSLSREVIHVGYVDLGALLPHRRRKLFAARLADAAAELLSDENTRGRVRRLQRQVAEADSITRCADLLERLSPEAARKGSRPSSCSFTPDKEVTEI